MTIWIVAFVWILWLALRTARLEQKLSVLERRLDLPPEPEPDPDTRMKATGRKAWYGSLLNRVK